MSIDLMVMKASDGSLRPVTDDDIEKIQKLKVGKELGVKITTLRKGRFHRKVFSLLKFAFDNSERITGDYQGKKVEQSFRRFRQDLVIMSGHYHVDVSINGDVRATAQSLEYDECSQELIEEIYSDVLDVICQKVFTDDRYTREQLEEITENLMGYV